MQGLRGGGEKEAKRLESEYALRGERNCHPLEEEEGGGGGRKGWREGEGCLHDLAAAAQQVVIHCCWAVETDGVECNRVGYLLRG